MVYPYGILPASLHETADASIEWFRKSWGIPKGAIQVESSVHADIKLRPTFQARTSDFHTLCIEVMESTYSPTLDSFILDCQKRGLPVLLFVAYRKGLKDPDFPENLRAAKRAGVGLFEVDAISGDIINNALSTSLTGVRQIDLKTFPPKYRQGLQQAEQSFRDGQPAKACSMVYDKLEAAFRRFAEKCAKEKLWKNATGLDVRNCSWAALIKSMNNLNRNHPGTRRVNDPLLASLLAVTPHRNETGHEPASQQLLIRRDHKLRTRFESAVDLLQDFLRSTKFKV